MHFAVFVDQLTDGLDTPGGTEAQYAFSLVKMLAHYGHTVHCYGGNYTDPPSWGSQTPLDNIQFFNYWDVQDLEYEAFINIPHQHRKGDGSFTYCTDQHIKAKKYLHCQFSWTNESETLVPKDCWNSHNHLICMPWELTKFRNNNPKIRFLPFPYYQNLKAHKDLDNRRAIFWAARDPFNADLARKHPLMSLYATKLIEAVAALSNSYSIPCYFFNAQSFESTTARNTGALRAFKTVRLKTIYKELVPKSVVLTALANSKLALTPPNQMGSCVDAMIAGTIPIMFKQIKPFNNYCEEGFDYICRMNQLNHVLEISMTIKDIKDTIENAYHSFYPAYADTLRQISSNHQFKKHSWENSHNRLLEIRKT